MTVATTVSNAIINKNIILDSTNNIFVVTAILIDTISFVIFSLIVTIMNVILFIINLTTKS